VICGGIRPPTAARKAYPDLAKLTPPDLPESYSEAAERVGKTPVWIFHGADDDIVPVTESRRMYEAMKRIGAEVLYTEYPGGTHASWERAYEEPKLFPWLFSKSLGVLSKTGSARQTDHQAERHSRSGNRRTDLALLRFLLEPGFCFMTVASVPATNDQSGTATVR
jgi:acetyl esterase/lipase